MLGCAHSISGASHSLDNVDYGVHSIKIGVGEGFANFELNHSVDGYEVDCKKDLMMVWGKPVILNESSPQDSNLTIIDLMNLKIRKIVYFDKGVYDIDFLESPLKAIGRLLDFSGHWLQLGRRARRQQEADSPSWNANAAGCRSGCSQPRPR